MATLLSPQTSIGDFQTAVPETPNIMPLAFKENSPILGEIEIVEDVN